MENMEENDTRHSLSAILREKPDYTRWRHEFFDDMTTEEFEAAAAEWAKTHPGITGSCSSDARNVS